MVTPDLRDVLPNLAAARDLAACEQAAFDEPDLELRKGDRYALLLDWAHRTRRCRCGGTIDEYEVLTMLAVGPNAGTLGRDVDASCRDCHSARTSCNLPPGAPPFSRDPHWPQARLDALTRLTVTALGKRARRGRAGHG